MTEAFECGAVVNPEHLRNQVEGAVAMGLGGALFEQIEFADNRITNPRLSRYRVPRFGDMPVIESVLLDRKDIRVGGRGRDADRGNRAGGRKCDFRRDRTADPLAAAGAERVLAG